MPFRHNKQKQFSLEPSDLVLTMTEAPWSGNHLRSKIHRKLKERKKHVLD